MKLRGKFKAGSESEGVMDEESGESTAEEVTCAGKSESEIEKPVYEVVEERQGEAYIERNDQLYVTRMMLVVARE